MGDNSGVTLLALLLAASLGPGVGIPPGPGESVATMGALWPAPANPEGEFAWEILLRLPPGWHVQSHWPRDEFLIPTAFEPDPVPGVEWLGVDYPWETVQELDWSDTPLVTFEGEVAIVAKGRAGGEPPLLTGTLTYQACTDLVCFAPRSVRIETEAEWSGDAPPAPPGSVIARQGGPREVVPLPETVPDPDPVRSEVPVPAWWALLLAGVGLAFSPCVYPILPVVLLSATDGRRGLPAAVGALPLVGGLAAAYAVAGGLAASAGLLGGAALQNGLVGWGLVVLFAAAGLLMLGGWAPEASPRLGRLVESLRGRGKAGIGAALGVAAAPCTTPVLAGVSGVAAAAGQPLVGMGLFALLGVGMGLPLLVVAMAGAQLPRGGVWLAWIKRGLGALLLGYAAFVGWARVDPGDGSVPPPAGATVYYLSARWCVPCYGIKAEVWPDPAVAGALEGWEFVELDLTEESAEELEFRRLHGVAGVPALVAVPTPGGPASFVHNGDFGVEEALEALGSA